MSFGKFESARTIVIIHRETFISLRFRLFLQNFSVHQIYPRKRTINYENRYPHRRKRLLRSLLCPPASPRQKITVITKSDLTSNDSFLAQGGMCMLKEQSDYDSFFEDTMKAGHYENDKKSVEIMIKTSRSCQGSCLLRCPVRAK